MTSKVRVNLTMDAEVVEKAKSLGLNISKISDLLNISVKQVPLRYSVELTKAVISQRSIKSKKESAEI